MQRSIPSGIYNLILTYATLCNTITLQMHYYFMQSTLCNTYTISNTMQLYTINVMQYIYHIPSTMQLYAISIMQSIYHIPSYAILYNINYHLNLYNVIQCYAILCNTTTIYRNTHCYATMQLCNYTIMQCKLITLYLIFTNCHISFVLFSDNDLR